MNERTVTIYGEAVKLSASISTLIWYKRITGRDFYADYTAWAEEYINSAELIGQYTAFIKDVYSHAETFEQLPKDKQDEYWQKLKSHSKGLSGLKVDLQFAADTVCAMALAGGYKGGYEKLLTIIVPADVLGDSELSSAFKELFQLMLPDAKKKQEALVTPLRGEATTT